MRYIYIALLALVTFIVIIFKIQNIGAVTLLFFSSSVTMPLSLLILIVYLIGMLTGGIVIAAIRSLTTKVRPASQLKE